MKKRTIIPECPKPFTITQKAKGNIEKWIQYLKNLSPRIIIKLPYDNDFDLDSYKAKVKSIQEPYFWDNENIIDWPEKEQITFLLSYDSSLPGHKKELLIKNTYFFCYYDLAFGLDYFKWDGDIDDEPDCDTFSLRSYPKSALSWKYITKLIKDRIIEIENSVKKAP